MDMITYYIATAVAVFCVFFLYVKIRPLFHIRANCWFCNKDCIVPYLYRNSFECPYCQQYNGFLPDGGYNVVVPAQHDELLNTTAKFANTPTKHVPGRKSNGLCANCNLIQEMKIRHLSSFVPLKESRYNEELSELKQHLEEVYGLCAQCESTVNKFLAKQDSWLLNIVRAWRRSHKKTLSPKSWFRSSAICLLHCVIVFGALVLNAAKLLYTEEGRQFLPFTDTEEDMCPVPPVTLSVVLATEFYWIMLGMFIQMFLTVFSGLKWIDMSCSFSWALLFICYSCISTDYINEMHMRISCVFISVAVILLSATSLFVVSYKTDSTSPNIWKTINDDTDFIQKWNRTRTFGWDTPPTVLEDSEYNDGVLSSTTASCSSHSKLKSRSVADVKSKILVKKATSSQELNINNLKKSEIEDLDFAFSNMNIDKTVNNFRSDGSLLKPSRLTDMKNKSEKSKNIASWVGGGFWDKHKSCQTIVDDIKPFSDTQTLFSTPTHSRSSNETGGYFSNRTSPLNSSDSCVSVNNHIPGFSNYQLSPLGPPKYQLSPLGPSCSPPFVFSVPYMSGTYVHTVISQSPEFITQNMFSFPFPSSSVPGFHKYLHNDIPTFQNNSHDMSTSKMQMNEKSKWSYYFLFAAYIPCVIICYELLKYLILTWSDFETVHIYSVDSLWNLFKF